MKIYINSKFETASVENIVGACQEAVKGYKIDDCGREYYMQQTESNILQKVYTEEPVDGSENYEDWTYEGSQIDKLSGNLEVEFSL